MTEPQSRWKSVTDRQKWATRGASFVGKVKATKLVWFPPKPEETGKKAASTAKETTSKPGKKTTNSSKKVTSNSKKVTNPVRQNKT